MNIEWMKTLYTVITIFFAAIVHGVAGFGLAQIAMGVLPFFRTAASASAIFGISAMVSNFQVWLSVRDEFDFKSLAKPLIGLVVGMPLGIYVFNNLNEEQMNLAIGIVIIIAVILIIIGKQTDILENLFKRKDRKEGTVLPIVVGFTAGILGGAVAIPGPPMIIYGTFMTSIGSWTGKKMKSIFTAFFGTLMLYRTIGTVVTGDMTMGLFLEALITIPAVILGSFIGVKLFSKLSSKVFNWIIIAMLVANGILLLIK